MDCFQGVSMFRHSRLKRFLRDEDGVATADLMVVMALMVGIGITAVTEIRSGAGALGSDMSTSFSSSDITLAQADDEAAADDGSASPDPDPIPDPLPEPDPVPEPEPDPEPTPEPDPEPDPDNPPEGCWYNGAGQLKCN